MPSPDTRWNMKYELLFPDDAAYTDVTSLVDTRETSITDNGASSELKSSISVCKFTLKYGSAAQLVLHNSVVTELLAAKESLGIVLFKLTGLDTFTGKVDLSNISQVNKRIPGWLTIEAEDNSYLLDVDIPTSFEYPNNDDLTHAGWAVFDKSAPSTSIVHQLLFLAGYLVTDVDASSENIATVIKRVVYDATKPRTFRDLIDTLLMECGAVFTFGGDGKIIIKNLMIASPSSARTVSGIMNSSGMNTKGGDYQNDGVKVEWSELSVAEDANIFEGGISQSRDEQGIIIGDEIAAESYWPETGDIEEIWQDYNANFLDRPYLTKKSRLQNKDLSLISVKNLVISVIKDAEIVMVDGYPVKEPTRARVLFYNSDATTPRFLKALHGVGDALFRSKVLDYTFPTTAAKPSEYVSEFMFGSTQAQALANYLHKFRLYGDLSHSWSELNTTTPMFQIVTVAPPDGAISTLGMVISTKKSFPAPYVIKRDNTAIGISAFNSEAVVSTITIPGTPPVNTGEPSRGVTARSTSLSIPTTSRGVPTISTIIVTADLQNLVIPTGGIVWTCTDPAVTLTPVVGNDYAVSIDTSEVEDSSIVVVPTITAGGIPYSGQVGIAKVANGTPAPLNLGVLDAAPTQTALGEAIVAGDYFLYYKATADAPYVNGTSYRYNGTAWVAVTSSTTDYSSIMANTLADAMKLPSTVSVTSAYNGYFTNLAAYSAFIENLGTAYLKLLTSGGVSGCIHSDYYNTDGTVNSGSSAIKGLFLSADGRSKLFNSEVMGTLRTGANAPSDARVGIRDAVGITEGPTFVGSGLNDLSIVSDGAVEVTVRVKIETAATVYALGDTGPAGGKIFHIYHGIAYECAPLAAEASKEWGGSGTSVSTSQYVGYGNSNTEAIVAALGAGDYAAKYCADLTYGGFSDWFLPSRFEAQELGLNNAYVGDMQDDQYWTSSQSSATYAWEFNGLSGSTNLQLKTLVKLVRPIRSFSVADTFKVSIDDGANYGSEIAIPAYKQYAIPDKEITIGFGSHNGHTVADYWRFVQSAMKGLVIQDVNGVEYLKASDGVLEIKKALPKTDSDIGDSSHKFRDGWFSRAVGIGTPSMGTNGSVDLPNGMILKWGKASCPSSTPLTIDLSEHSAYFPTACLFAIGSTIRTDYTLSGFDYTQSFNALELKFVTSTAVGNYFAWLALGY